MLSRRSPRSPQTYMRLAVVAAAIGVLDVVVGLGAIYALIVFVFAVWALSCAWRAAGRR